MLIVELPVGPLLTCCALAMAAFVALMAADENELSDLIGITFEAPATGLMTLFSWNLFFLLFISSENGAWSITLFFAGG